MVTRERMRQERLAELLRELREALKDYIEFHKTKPGNRKNVKL